MRRIEKQMCAHPHVRLGHGSKDTAHVRIDTSLIIISMLSFKSPRCHSNSQIVSLGNSKEGEYPPGAELQMSTLHSQKWLLLFMLTILPRVNN